MQLLARSSEEHGSHLGLGWIAGDVVRLQPSAAAPRIPHMGWNDIALTSPHPLFDGLRPTDLCFYFVHSYHLVCDDATSVAACCEYGMPLTAAVGRGNIFATQFHPEKSQDNGLQVLRNFSTWCPQVA